MVFRYHLFKEKVAADIVIVLPYFTDIKQFPDLLANEREVSELMDKTVMYYINIWKALDENEGCRVIQANFVIPPEHLLGNPERQ